MPTRARRALYALADATAPILLADDIVYRGAYTATIALPSCRQQHLSIGIADGLLPRRFTDVRRGYRRRAYIVHLIAAWRTSHTSPIACPHRAAAAYDMSEN